MKKLLKVSGSIYKIVGDFEEIKSTSSTTSARVKVYADLKKYEIVNKIKVELNGEALYIERSENRELKEDDKINEDGLFYKYIGIQ